MEDKEISEEEGPRDRPIVELSEAVNIARRNTEKVKREWKEYLERERKYLGLLEDEPDA